MRMSNIARDCSCLHCPGLPVRLTALRTCNLQQLYRRFDDDDMVRYFRACNCRDAAAMQELRRNHSARPGSAARTRTDFRRATMSGLYRTWPPVAMHVLRPLFSISLSYPGRVDALV